MKKGFFSLLFMLLQELLVILLALVCIRICFILAEVAYTESSGLFSVDIFELNWLMVFVGLIVFVGIFVLIWEKMLSVKFRELWSLAIGWRVAAIRRKKRG